MKTRVVSFSVAKKLVETGFIGESRKRWEINSSGKAELKETVSSDNKQLGSGGDLKDNHYYPAYSIEEFFFEMYFIMKSKRMAANSIPVFLVSLAEYFKRGNGFRRMLRNPADFMARQYIKAMQIEYMLENPKDHCFSFSD